MLRFILVWFLLYQKLIILNLCQQNKLFLNLNIINDTIIVPPINSIQFIFDILVLLISRYDFGFIFYFCGLTC